MSSASAAGIVVVKKVVRCLLRPRAPFVWHGSKRSALFWVGPGAFRPFCGLVGYVCIMEKGAEGSKLAP